MRCVTNPKCYKVLRKTPIIGDIFRIANAYAYKGKIECHARIAPLRLWWKRIIFKMLIILFFVSLVLCFSGLSLRFNSWHPADTILSVFPSILGFGIGVYALMFIMPSDFLIFLKERHRLDKSKISHEIVPVDMGYPLVVFIISLCIASINKLLQGSLIFNFLSLFILFYGLAMAIELMSFLFNSSVMIQKIRTKDDIK
ncbi:hypothetical protein KKJ01_21295 [Xenorhabdus bovienii]|uniref:Uncharacterized protein n=1 Tax=Xenorhabdus bovienii TaxID=40576 RepID=A0AAJ1JBF1_XENBV|nr:hypothetical protein [Xenorhabdus bovienii]MDE1480650.1 hypothetical protein [Xenorhabdus bovienii]MDE1492488.1 hypothetical protein [Xenorhabdus bovienii]MDE9475384.1 hypothetical protein [Xenorhabdus bovienii]MDE9512371.1 hypothetical protein [Xenorhabdus bovienii]MDE9524007.1 hypothetical protein [Xenorhabdus bovienii]